MQQVHAPGLKPEHEQHTVASVIHYVGRGLHSGRSAAMTLLPGEPDTGYVFDRQDMPVMRGEVPARWYNVTETRLNTTISNSFGVRVSTIEHLIAALRGTGVDNCRILLDGPEVPIMDGSALPFVELIERYGTRGQGVPRRAIVVTRPVMVEHQGARAALLPASSSLFDVEIDFEHNAIGQQRCAMEMTPALFRKHIAAARTFGFADDVDTLRRHGLALGGSLSNAILVGEGGVLNDGGLRYQDEFVRHKFLDAVGDLSLAGAPIIGRFIGYKSGHRLNNDVLRELMADTSRWRMSTMAEEEYPREAMEVV